MAGVFRGQGSWRSWSWLTGRDAAGPAVWKADLGAGLVVCLVALPLCLGIALASGAPLVSGLVTGVVGGVLVSRLSGAQLMVSGPAAGLTTIVLAALAQLGSFEAFLLAVFLAGLLQMALGLARAGAVINFVPSSVIRGMLTGIGLILVLKQLPYALGLPGGAGLSAAAQGTLPAAVALSLLSLGLLVMWPRLAPARWRRLLPAPLAVVLLGGAASWAVDRWAGAWGLPPHAMVALPVPASLTEMAAYFTAPDWGALSRPEVYQVALTVAIVASLESLLSLEATDRLDPLKRSSSPHRELFAQGAGNMVCGLVGGLPMTGVIVRSAANIDAGGRTWRSSFIHGVLLALAVGSVPAWLNHIPLATLAAVLIHTGFKLAHPRQLADAARRGPRYALPFLATVAVILMADLLAGIAVGLAVGLCFVLWDSARDACSLERQAQADHQQVLLILAEKVSFLNKAQIHSALRSLPAGATVTVDATRSRQLDHDVLDLLHDYLDKARASGVRVILKGVPVPGSAGAPH